MKKSQQGNSVVGGVIWKFAERIMNQGVAFLVSLVLARLLTPEDYGTIALVLVFRRRPFCPHRLNIYNL